MLISVKLTCEILDDNLCTATWKVRRLNQSPSIEIDIQTPNFSCTHEKFGVLTWALHVKFGCRVCPWRPLKSSFIIVFQFCFHRNRSYWTDTLILVNPRQILQIKSHYSKSNPWLFKVIFYRVRASFYRHKGPTIWLWWGGGGGGYGWFGLRVFFPSNL